MHRLVTYCNFIEAGHGVKCRSYESVTYIRLAKHCKVADDPVIDDEVSIWNDLLMREAMSKGNVISLAERKAALQTEAEFLDLLDLDLKSNPEGIKPLPQGLVQRILAIRAQADENRRRELQEG